MNETTTQNEIAESGYSSHTEMASNIFDDEDDDDDFNFRQVRVKAKSNIFESDDEDLEETQPTTKEIIAHDRLENDEADDSGISDSTVSLSQVQNILKDTDVFDAEESDEDKPAVAEWENEGKNEENYVTRGVSKSSNKKHRNNKTLKTVKEEKDNRMQIYRESQRLVRESRVCLPYHQPEQKPLDYFLQRKKRVPSRIKPSPNDLEILFESFESSDSCTIKKEETVCGTELSASIPPSDANDSDKLDENLQINLKSEITQDGENDSVNDDKRLGVDIKLDEARKLDTENEIVKDETNQKFYTSETSQTAVRRLLIENALERFVPRLSGKPNTFIDLEESEQTTQTSDINNILSRKHIDDLKSKFLKLTERSSTNRTKICTTTNDCEIENNKAENDVPGAQLLRLKKKLKVKMVADREERRLKRFEDYAMDNEEGFAIEEEEEEAELTDQTDTDEEEVEEEEEEEEQDVIATQKKKVPRNIFIDDEAEDDDYDYNDECRDDDDDDNESEVSREAGSPTKATDFDRNRTMELFPNECDFNNHSNNITYSTPKLNTNLRSNDSSEFTQPLIMPTITPWQPGGGIRRKRSCGSEKSPVSDNDNSFLTQLGDDKDTSFVLSPTSRNFQETQGDCSLVNPLVDVILNKYKYYRKQSEEGESLSQFGVSQISLSNTIYAKPQLFKPNSKKCESQDMDDILSLCSGKFSESVCSESEVAKEHFVTTNSQSQTMDEFSGLCSGSFKSQNPEGGINNVDLDENLSLLKTLDENDENSCSLFRKVKRKRIDDDEDEDDEEEEHNSESYKENNDDENQEINKGLEEEIINFDHNKNRMSEFFDEEAELSGSDASSDEDEPAEEDDVMEIEDGDNDELIPNDEILREQVGRVYNKALLDEDKRELRLMKEMYLEDGDLHSDGKRRERKFRWREMYENSEDMQNNVGSDGDDSEEDLDESSWRVNRHERDVWIAKHKKENDEMDDDDIEKSNVPPMKIVLRKSMDFSQSKPNVFKSVATPKTSKKVKEKQPGSFLHRSVEFSKKFAEINKSSDANPKGVKNSRNFVFAAVSPPNKTSNQKNPALSSRKKPKLEPKSLEQKFNNQNNSIFGYL